MAKLTGSQRLQKELGRIGTVLSGGSVVRVGFLQNATYPNGTPVALVAFWNEFGTRFMPSRPFFRNMIAAKKDEWGPAIAGLLRSTNFNVPRTLALTGQAIAGQLRESIINTNSPPNAQSTIDRKGHAKPLVGGNPAIGYAGGHMLGSVDSEVRA